MGSVYVDVLVLLWKWLVNRCVVRLVVLLQGPSLRLIGNLFALGGAFGLCWISVRCL